MTNQNDIPNYGRVVYHGHLAYADKVKKGLETLFNGTDSFKPEGIDIMYFATTLKETMEDETIAIFPREGYRLDLKLPAEAKEIIIPSGQGNVVCEFKLGGNRFVIFNKAWNEVEGPNSLFLAPYRNK